MHQFLLAQIKANQLTARKTLEIGSIMAEQLGLHNDQNISLAIGQFCLPLVIKIAEHKMPQQQISLHPQDFKSIDILEENKYGIVRKDNKIQLGPLIGIMADKQQDSRRPFRDQSFFISQLSNEGREIGAVCFAFSANDINFNTRKIQGYSYSNKRWQKGIFPFPDVIYARYKGHSLKKNDIRNRFIKTGCKFINPALMGKWRCYRILSENNALKTYLPETRLIKSFADVEEMLKKYRGIYLKPVSGSQGENIVRVRKVKENKYAYQYRTNNRSIKETVGSINELQRSLKKIMGSQSYIVQQELYLIRFKGGLVDFRVMVQKDDTDQWLSTGKACRIGKNGSITSNISGGGSADKVDDILLKCLYDPQAAARISTEIDDLALKSARELEKHYPAIGELGIDIGLDQDGRLWFIEANLKPARKVFSLLGDKEIRLLSVQRPLLYARYLAGF